MTKLEHLTQLREGVTTIDPSNPTQAIIQLQVAMEAILTEMINDAQPTGWANDNQGRRYT